MNFRGFAKRASAFKSPLEVIFLIDTSLSMKDEKIQSVNYAIDNFIKDLKSKAKVLPSVQFEITIITFGADNAEYYNNARSIKLDNFEYQPIEKVGGMTSTSKALKVLNDLLDEKTFPKTKYQPTIVFISDGLDTDGYLNSETKDELIEQFNNLNKSFWYRCSNKCAIQIGSPSQSNEAILRAFTKDPETIYVAEKTSEILDAMNFVTMTCQRQAEAKTTKEPSSRIKPEDILGRN